MDYVSNFFISSLALRLSEYGPVTFSRTRKNTKIIGRVKEKNEKKLGQNNLPWIIMKTSHYSSMLLGFFGNPKSSISSKFRFQIDRLVCICVLQEHNGNSVWGGWALAPLAPFQAFASICRLLWWTLQSMSPPSCATRCHCNEKALPCHVEPIPSKSIVPWTYLFLKFLMRPQASACLDVSSGFYDTFNDFFFRVMTRRCLYATLARRLHLPAHPFRKQAQHGQIRIRHREGHVFNGWCCLHNADFTVWVQK